MDFGSIVIANRSYRRFDQSVAISQETLRELVGLTTRVPSAMNAQALRYILINDAQKNATIFENLAWAAALPDWPGPSEGERPSAYVVVLTDTRIKSMPDVDAGIAMQTMLLGAAERGLGGCMFGSIRKAAVVEALQIPEHVELRWIVALGKPVEKVVLEPMGAAGSTKYHRDADRTHYVPKRSLDDLILQIGER